MGAYLGDTEIGQMFLGSTEIGQAYLGSTKVWAKKQLLPYDAEIEYLQSSGTQWIDTGVYGYMNHTYELVYQKTTMEKTPIWGCLGDGGLNQHGQTIYLTYAGNNIVLYWNADGASYFNLNPIDTNKHIFKIANGATYFDNMYKFTPNTHDPNFSISYNIYLFSRNSGGKKPVPSYPMRVYSYKDIDIDGNVVLDLIPVRLGTTGYMYDKVSGQLFGNAGTGDFILGNDITT